VALRRRRKVRWRHRLVGLAVLVCLGFLLSHLESDAHRHNSGPVVRVGARVIRIVDGDTIEVLLGGRREHVRLLRINTPERGQPGYEEAKGALARLVAGGTVSLEPEEGGSWTRDPHGRLLAYVFVDGLHVNVEMVRLGWSDFWTRYGEGRYASQFRQAAREAQAARRGLWGLRDVQQIPGRAHGKGSRGLDRYGTTSRFLSFLTAVSRPRLGAPAEGPCLNRGPDFGTCLLLLSHGNEAAHRKLGSRSI
jgi:endonuclease YncB( thermonuclease family)